ncbi:peptidase M24 [Rhizoctonia solani AG-1 IA]|uniref:Peptidase M24 n=1 Tax=Thanatephorus cucumeris (strain AG1-IA) TaxID=983506 RepID=L8WM00_THACA|nr:peptidase M24 [Rhizoctonia solani AG-1 IA]
MRYHPHNWILGQSWHTDLAPPPVQARLRADPTDRFRYLYLGALPYGKPPTDYIEPLLSDRHLPFYVKIPKYFTAHFPLYLRHLCRARFRVSPFSSSISKLHTPNHCPHSDPCSNSKYGQPLHDSHPHLLEPGELTPGIQASEYAGRRKKLMDSLPTGSVVLCSAADYKFRQSSNFWYLTGIEEQDAAILLQKTSSGKGHKTYLFVKDKDPYDELWHGPRTGVQQSVKIFAADEGFSIEVLCKILDLVLKDANHFFADVPSQVADSGVSKTSPKGNDDVDTRKTQTKKFAQRSDETQKDQKFGGTNSDAQSGRCQRHLTCQGKSPCISIPCRMFFTRRPDQTMRFAKSAETEAQLAAHFEYVCALQGAQRPAYVPVVARGGYASDITRTFPVGPSGQFTPPQRELYASILEVQKKLILMCTEESKESMNSLHNQSVDLLKKALRRVGFDLGAGGKLIDRLYPHYLTHPIGIERNDPVVLSINAPKEIADVEATCQGSLGVGPY